MSIDGPRDVMWLALAFFLALGGVGLTYVLWRTARLLRRLERELHRTVDEVIPVISKSSVSMDTINSQLEKVDIALDSAVDMTEALDTTVRAVSIAVSEPVKKASAAFAGVAGAVDGFRGRMDGEPLGDTHVAEHTDEEFDDPFAPDDEPNGGSQS